MRGNQINYQSYSHRLEYFKLLVVPLVSGIVLGIITIFVSQYIQSNQLNAKRKDNKVTPTNHNFYEYYQFQRILLPAKQLEPENSDLKQIND